MSFDLDKIMANGGHCVTRDGRKARIICTDAKFQQPIVALVLGADGKEWVGYWHVDGLWWKNGAQSPNDLLNAPAPKRKVRLTQWAAVYEGGYGCFYVSRAQAVIAAKITGGFAIIEIDREVEEGEGL